MESSGTYFVILIASFILELSYDA